MAENKNAKTSADGGTGFIDGVWYGPEYERGFVDGMQRQMQLSVKINKESTKIFGPGLEELLNSAGFYRKREWQGLTDEEIITHFQTNVDIGSLLSFVDGARYAEAKLKEKNRG